MFNLSIDKVDGKHFKNIDFEFTGDTQILKLIETGE